MKVCINSF